MSELDRAVKILPADDPWWRLYVAVRQGRPSGEIEQIFEQNKDSERRFTDGEPPYFAAEILAVAGLDKHALDMLRNAVDRNYCSYPALDNDPTFATLRTTPEYQQIHESAIACQHRFLQWRARNAP